MKERFFSYLCRLVAEPEKAKFLLTVSGGKDSCALLHLFSSCGLHFDIAHCNFHLREKDSDEDMEFVMELALKYHSHILIKEFYHHDFDQKGKSLEMIARELRYQWFEELSMPYDFIVTAHHANDNAETLLLNLTRGTGLKGMTGISPVNGKIIRPLLAFSSCEIADYLEEEKLEYRIDYTNLSEQYQRNKIRLSIIPKLEEINPNFIHTSERNVEVFNKQYDFYIQKINELKDLLIHQKKNKIHISIDDLFATGHVSLMLYEILSGYHFNSNTIELIVKSLDKHSGKRFYSSSHVLIKDRKELIVSPIKIIDKKFIIISDKKILEQYGFEVELMNDTTNIEYNQDKSVLYADAEKLTFPLVLRYWEDGDFFYPLGMKGKKKLSDFFNDEKIDILSKHTIPILCCKNDIVWLIGYRSDDRFKIDKDKTKQFYKIKYYGIR